MADERVRLSRSRSAAPLTSDEYCIGPIFAFSGTRGAIDYYRAMRDQAENRLRARKNSITPARRMANTAAWLVDL